MSGILNKQTRLNRTLLKAAEKGSLEKVKKLLEKGANIQAAEKYTDRTPLFLAALNNKLEVVSFLLEKGADINHQSDKGWEDPTVLVHACRCGKEALLNILMTYKPDLDLIGNGGYTALSSLVNVQDQNLSIKMASTLIDSGAGLDVTDSCGSTALHTASYCGRFNLVKLLVERGADLHAQDGQGRKPMARAQSEKKHAVADYLSSLMKPVTSEPKTVSLKTPLPPKKETVQLEDGWKLITPKKIALVSDESIIGRSLTEVFNFEAQTYTRISQNLKTKAENYIFKEFNEFTNVSFLEKAHEALLAQGGQAEKPVVKTSRPHKLGKAVL